jgi:hypothetical protein
MLTWILGTSPLQVKSVLIQSYVREKDRVLDFACGRGLPPSTSRVNLSRSRHSNHPYNGRLPPPIMGTLTPLQWKPDPPITSS